MRGYIQQALTEYIYNSETHEGDVKDKVRIIFLRFYLFFRERVREEEKEEEETINVKEKHQSVASRLPPTGDLACNPGMCSGNRTSDLSFCRTTKPHQLGL